MPDSGQAVSIVMGVPADGHEHKHAADIQPVVMAMATVRRIRTR